jgi:hypothetical protein
MKFPPVLLVEVISQPKSTVFERGVGQPALGGEPGEDGLDVYRSRSLIADPDKGENGV